MQRPFLRRLINFLKIKELLLALHKVEGLSYQEVSEAMKTTVSSVESLMHRAKNNLKKSLEDYYKTLYLGKGFNYQITSNVLT